MFDDLLFLIILIIFGILSFFIGQILTNRKWESKLSKIRKDAVKTSRAVLSGQFSEQLAPYLPDFPYKPTEARFLGKPIDLLIFKGMDEKDIKEVIFVEIKSGKARLTPNERKLRDAILEKKVSWVEYRVPEELTRRKPVD